MSFKTDKGRVIGLGSAKHGTGHFWVQRITAVALVPLFLLAILVNAAVLLGRLPCP